MNTVAAAEQSTYDWAALLRLWQELDVPEGWRAELSYEQITMTPPSANSHVRIASKVSRPLTLALPAEYGVHQSLGVAVEIPSPNNAKHERDRKRRAYAHGGVPLYLLIDRFDRDGPASTLFREPVDGVYRQSLRMPLGEAIPLPAPFDFELDTSQF